MAKLPSKPKHKGNAILLRFSQAGRLIGSTYASIAALVAALCFVIALAGVSGLLCLGFLRYHAGEDADVVRALAFDYSTPVAIASVSLVESSKSPGGSSLLPWPFLRRSPYPPEAQGGRYDYLWSEPPSHHTKSGWFGEKPPPPHQPWHALPAPPFSGNRAFPVGREFSVLVTLQLPVHYTELFQITGELLTTDNKVVARAVHTHLAKPESPLQKLIRSCLWFPLYFVGYYEHTHDVQFRLFNRLVEKQSMPVTRARVYLKSRNTTIGSLPPPPIHSADLRIQQRLGWYRTLLSWVRPGLTTTVILAAIASTVAGFGSFTAASALAVAIILHRVSKAPKPLAEPKGEPLPTYSDPLPLAALEPASPPSDAENAQEQWHFDFSIGDGLSPPSEFDDVGVNGASQGGSTGASFPWSENSQNHNPVGEEEHQEEGWPGRAAGSAQHARSVAAEDGDSHAVVVDGVSSKKDR